MVGTVIIDGNSLCHASHYAPKLTVGTMQTQAIFGMIKSVRVTMNKYRGWKFLVLWDGRAEWRYELYPEYKGNREAKNEAEAAVKAAYKAQSPFVRKGLSLLGVRQMLATTHEADDLAGIMSKQLSRRGVKVQLVTGDQDWLQLVDENISWFDPIREYEVNLANFDKFTGYLTPLQFLDGKALVGDISDNIGGVGGIGETGAPELLAEFGSVANFYSLVESGKFIPKQLVHIRLCGDSEYSKEEWKARFVPTDEQKASEKAYKKAFTLHMKEWTGQGRTLFKRNMRLMDLQNVPVPKSEDISNLNIEYNEAKFRYFCEKLAFISILRNFEDFMKPFREMK
jgi:5'-3' exonuclease